MTDVKLKFRLKNVLDPLVLSTNYSIHNINFRLNLNLCDALQTPLFILFINNVFRNTVVKNVKRAKAAARRSVDCLICR